MTTVAELIKQEWKNGYGSTLTINTVTGIGQIIGPYSSTTGSSGIYVAVGVIDTSMAVPAPGAAGVPVSVAIYWKATNKPSSEADPSWHWVSAMSGQLVVPKTGPTELNFIHGLTASSSWIAPSLGVDTYPGTYEGQLHFTPYTPPVGEKSDKEFAVTELPEEDYASNSNATVWTCNEDPTITMTLSTATSYGVVVGLYQNSLGTSSLQGVMDVDASTAGLPLQSVSLTALVTDPESNETAALTLSGTIDLATSVMTTTVLTSRSKDGANLFYQTAVSSLTFTKT